MRPFFLTPDGTKPTPLKPYYDFVSWLTTQLILSFTVIPFLILYFNDTIHVWAHVYFYGIVAVAAAVIFFASPAKGFLIRQLKKRNQPSPTPPQKANQESAAQKQPMLGLPGDPEKEVEDAVREIAR